MKRWTAAAIAILAAILVAWYCLRTPSIAIDIYLNEQMEVDGVARRYRLAVPQSLPRGAPVAFAFHGVGDSAAAMAEYSQLDDLAARENFLLVYPEARGGIWPVMEAAEGDDGDEGGIDAPLNADVRFFDLLLDRLARRYSLDRRRVYLVGMSNGASFALRLALARPNEVAAVAAHSGVRPRHVPLVGETPPVLLIVGENDAVFAAVRENAREFREHGSKVDFIAVPNLAHAWSVAHNEAIWEFLSRHIRD